MCVCHVWPSPSAAYHYVEQSFQHGAGNIIKLTFRTSEWCETFATDPS